MQPPTAPPAPACAPARTHHAPAVRWLLFGLMALFGITISMIGPALPSLAEQAGVALDTAGLAFTFNGLGFMVAVLSAGVAVDRLGRRPVFTLSLALMALGLTLVPLAPSFALMLLFLMVVGFGQAGLEVTTNVVAGDLDSSQRAAALNRLHLFFGLGSFAGPAAIATALGFGGIHWAFWAAAAISALMLLPVRMPLPAPASGIGSVNGAAQGPSPYRLAVAWLLALVLMAYVGAEVGIGGWLFVVLEQSAGLGAGGASLITSAFWLCLAGGRLAGSLVLRSQSLVRVLLGSIVAAGAGTLVLALGHSVPWLAAAGALLAGFAFGPIFPTTLAWATNRAPHAVGRVTGMCIALGGLGGMIFPWLQGKVLVNVGVGQALLLPLALTGVMALLVALTARRKAVA